jgi:hypothetical protein
MKRRRKQEPHYEVFSKTGSNPVVWEAAFWHFDQAQRYAEKIGEQGVDVGIYGPSEWVPEEKSWICVECGEEILGDFRSLCSPNCTGGK